MSEVQSGIAINSPIGMEVDRRLKPSFACLISTIVVFFFFDDVATGKNPIIDLSFCTARLAQRNLLALAVTAVSAKTPGKLSIWYEPHVADYVAQPVR